jgi:hypothetical protein
MRESSLIEPRRVNRFPAWLLEYLSHHIALGRQVRSGVRQSIPSSSIDACAAESMIVPVFVTGQGKWPRSRRLAKKRAETLAIMPDAFDQPTTLAAK